MTYPIKNILIPVLMVSSIVLMLGCNTFEADFDRDNPKDPKGSNFIHSSPEFFSVDIADAVISISWKDISSYNTGYIVEKAINDSTNYIRVATLPDDAELYRDESREIGEVVYYKISSFSTENGEETIVHTESLSISVEELSNAGAYSPGRNEISVGFRADNQFSDGVIIQEKSRLDTEYRTVKIVDFGEEPVPDNEYYGHKYFTDLQTFNLDIRIAAFQYRGDELVTIQEVVDSLSVNDPVNFEVEFENELETRVGWDYSVEFAEYYLLEVEFEESGKKLKYEIQPSDNSTVLDMEMEKGYARYTLQAVADDEMGAVQTKNLYFDIRMPTLRYSSKSLDAVTLQLDQWWEGPVKYSAILFERSVNGGSYEIIGEISPSEVQFTDTDLNPSNTYSYRIRSLTKGGQNVIELSNENKLVPVNSIEVEGIDNLRFSDIHFLSNDKVAYYRRRYQNTAGSDVEIFDLRNLDILTEFDSGSDVVTSRISPSENELFEIVSGDEFGMYDIRKWDLNSKSLIRTIEGAHSESSYTYVNGKLAFNRDGTILASSLNVDQDSEIKFWNTGTGELITTISIPQAQSTRFKFNPEKDELIVMTDRDLFIYDATNFELIFENRNITNDFSQIYSRISGDGRRLILFSYWRLTILDLDSKTVISNSEFESGISQLSSNQDATRLLIETNEHTAIYGTDPIELKQILRYDYNSYSNGEIALNPKGQGTAISISRGFTSKPSTITKWEQRDVWYMEPERY